MRGENFIYVQLFFSSTSREFCIYTLSSNIRKILELSGINVELKIAWTPEKLVLSQMQWDLPQAAAVSGLGRSKAVPYRQEAKSQGAAPGIWARWAEPGSRKAYLPSAQGWNIYSWLPCYGICFKISLV